MQITRKPVGQCYRKGVDNRTPNSNTLAMVFVRYTMDHDSRAYGTRIHDPWYIYSNSNTLSFLIRNPL